MLEPPELSRELYFHALSDGADEMKQHRTAPELPVSVYLPVPPHPEAVHTRKQA